MERRCLKCYATLLPNEVDYHSHCAVEIFGSPTPPTNIEESFTLLADNAALRDLTMRLASSAAVLTTPHTLVRGDDGGVVYCEKSIDKESMQMIMDEEEYKPNGSFEQLATVVEELSTISKLDLLNFWEQVLFCWVAGCSDVGYAALSMHEPHRGLYALTPASEFVASALLDHKDDSDSELSLTLNRKRKAITRIDFEAAMKRSGIKSKIINGLFTRYSTILPLWCETINSSHLDDESKSLYIKLLESRIGALA